MWEVFVVFFALMIIDFIQTNLVSQFQSLNEKKTQTYILMKSSE